MKYEVFHYVGSGKRIVVDTIIADEYHINQGTVTFRNNQMRDPVAFFSLSNITGWLPVDGEAKAG